MIAAAIIGGYVLVMLAAARIAYRAIREDGSLGGPIDACLDGLMALIAGLFWPVALPVAIVMWHPKPTADEISAALADREAENRKLQRRIAELERELGIGAR